MCAVFNKDEKVLWYDGPDPELAAFLYEACIVDVYELEDDNGKIHYQYKVHFRKWPKRNDIITTAASMIKDSPDIREKFNTRGIPIGVRAAKDKKMHTSSGSSQRRSAKRKRDHDESNEARDSRSNAGLHLLLNKDFAIYLEYDRELMLLGYKHRIPATPTILEILEDYVKVYAVYLVQEKLSEVCRGRVTDQRKQQIETELRKVIIEIKLLKETVDSVRVYFDFMLKTRLLYAIERIDVEKHISKESLSRAARLASSKLMPHNQAASSSVNNQMDIFNNVFNKYIHELKMWKPQYSDNIASSQQSGVRAGGNASTSVRRGHAQNHSNALVTADKLRDEVRTFLNEIFVWRLLPGETDHSPIMVYGATHLARLLVLMPEFVNKLAISDKKKELIGEHLAGLFNYLQPHKEWFGESNYIKKD